ncbi:MAG TPA: adenylate/guanylate cyclase domain-containing protein, partial [Rhizomicrobium sp.]|nr:adenylate/guanylate cyclase domain-containing protein [Rhizomicrobium sp.]
MRTRTPLAILALWLVPLLLLLLAAAVLLLNPAGATAALRSAEYDWFRQLSPHATSAPSTAELAVGYLNHLGTFPWLRNAAVLWPQLILLVATSAVLLWLLWYGRVVWAGVCTVVMIAVMLGVSWLLLDKAQIFVDTLTPSLALAFGYGGALLMTALLPARRVAVLPNRSLPEQVPAAEPEIAAAVPARPAVPPANRTVTYLVCRLRGAANDTRGLDAAGMMTLLETAGAPIHEAVAQHKGTLLYTSGSQLAAVWNAPDDDSEHALHACEAALRMMNGLSALKDQHGEGTPYESLQLGIGIASGSAVAGTLGNGSGDYSVVGECGDIADRLSRMAELYGAAILVAESTKRLDDKYALLEVDVIPTPWGAMPVYALYGNPLVRASPRFRALATFHEHLFQAIRAQR